jgi:hypothetical protein
MTRTDDTDQLPRMISSKYKTFMQKVLMPVAQVVVTIVITTSLLRDLHGKPHAMVVIPVVLISCTLGFLMLIGFGKSLVNIELDHGGINATGYLTTDFIPFSYIQEVKRNWWRNDGAITILLREDTTFGRKLAFLPKGNMPFFKDHAIIDELRELANIEVKRPLNEAPPPVPSPSGSLKRNGRTEE